MALTAKLHDVALVGSGGIPAPAPMMLSTARTSPSV